MNSSRLGFFSVNLTFTLATTAAGAFASLEVLPFFEADFFSGNRGGTTTFEGHFVVFVGRRGKLESFFGVVKALLSAKTHGLLSVSVTPGKPSSFHGNMRDLLPGPGGVWLLG